MADAKDIKKLRVIINKILKKIKRTDLDWTIQTSISSTEPDQTYYSVMIASPNQSLQPITWVKKTYEELEEALKKSSEILDETEILKAYYSAEVQRAKTMTDYYNEKLESLLDGES